MRRGLDVRRVGRCGLCRAGAERETGDTDGGEAQSGGAAEQGLEVVLVYGGASF